MEEELTVGHMFRAHTARGIRTCIATTIPKFSIPPYDTKILLILAKAENKKCQKIDTFFSSSVVP